MSDRSTPISGAWLVVALLWTVAGLNYLDRIMITTMRESLVGSIPMTDAQFGLLTSAFLWVYGILSPFAGFLSDRFSRSRIIIGSVVVWSTVTWLTGEAKSFEQLLAARALMGVSEACYLPAALALITDYHGNATRSLATGIHLTGLSVGSALGGIGGWLAERHGWSFPFHVCGMIGIVYSILLMIALKDALVKQSALESSEPSEQPGPVRLGEALSSLLVNRSFLLLLAFWGLLAVSSWLVIGWMPTYLREQFQLSQGAAGFAATGFYQGAVLFGLLIGGAWADYWNRTSSRGRIYVCSIGLAVAAPAMMLVGGTSILVVAIAGLILFGLARAFVDANMMPILCTVCDSRFRATAFGVLNLSASIVAGISIYLAGGMRDHQVALSSVFFVAGITIFACIFLILLVKPAPDFTSSEAAA